MCQMCWLLHFLFSTALWNKLYLYSFSKWGNRWPRGVPWLLRVTRWVRNRTGADTSACLQRPLPLCFATEMQEDAAGPGHLSQKSLCPSHMTIWALGWDQTMTVYHTQDLFTLYHPSQRGTMTLQSQAGSKISAKVTLLLRCVNTIGRPVACMPSCALEEKAPGASPPWVDTAWWMWLGQQSARWTQPWALPQVPCAAVGGNTKWSDSRTCSVSPPTHYLRRVPHRLFQFQTVWLRPKAKHFNLPAATR